MIKRLLLLTLFALGMSTPSFSQTSDQITYDIILDVSGSIPIFDNNGNLLSLLQQMIHVKPNSSKDSSINSYADFNIYFIGGNPDKILQRENYITIRGGKPKETQKILDAIKSQTADRRKQKTTHLHTALDEILKGVNDTSRKKVAGGVFIFSDAQIGENDFVPKAGDSVRANLTTYRKAINLKIAQIQTQMHKPVFLVQSYQLPHNDLTIIPDTAKYPNTHKDLINSNNWFWVRNSLVAKTDTNVQKAFQQFIDRANVTIVNFARPIPKNDKIAAAIKIEQIFEMARSLDSTYFSRKINEGKPGTMTAAELAAVQRVIKLVGKPSYTDADIKQLQADIDTLSQAPQALSDLGTEVSKKLGSQLSLISDPSLIAATFPAMKADIAPVKNAQGESMQAMILNGIAKYLVERVKQEIALYFIEQVNKRSINKPGYYVEIGEYLLPNTKIIISNPDNYTDINSLRTSLLKDISQLPDNLAAHTDLFGRSEGLVTLGYFYQLYNNIRQTNSLELSFERLGQSIEKKLQQTSPTMINAGSDGLDRKISKMEQSILFTSRLVGYLRNHDLSKVFIDQQPDTLTRMLSLLSLDGKYVKTIEDVNQLRPIINNIYLKYQDLKTTATKYEPLFKSSLTGRVQDLHTDQLIAVNDLLSRISDLLLSGSDILQLIQVDPKQVITRFVAPVQARIVKGQDVLVKLNKEYKFRFDVKDKIVSLTISDSTAVNRTVGLSALTDAIQNIKIGNIDYNIRLLNYNMVGTGQEIAFEIEKASNKISTDFGSHSAVRSAHNTMQAYFLFRQRNYADAVNLIVPELKTAIRDRIGSDTLVLEHIEKVLRIAGGVVNATSSDDIKNVIAKNAIGAGGYRNKRISHKTFYLNAYAGGAGTWYSGDNRFSGALFAPVGFELAWGNHGGAKRVRSWGIMLSVLDVGNIINYQLANNGANQTDVTSLSRAIAPGIYGTIGLSNHHPISVIFGYQVNPARFNIGVAFDLPIIAFMQRK